MLSLTTAQRDELLTLYRKDPDPQVLRITLGGFGGSVKFDDAPPTPRIWAQIRHPG